MLIVRDNNRTYYGDTYEELLKELHADQLLREPSDELYMKAVAKRVKLRRGRKIRTDTVEHFMLDMHELGLIELGIVQ
jgi:hypothetical protein